MYATIQFQQKLLQLLNFIQEDAITLFTASIHPILHDTQISHSSGQQQRYSLPVYLMLSSLVWRHVPPHSQHKLQLFLFCVYVLSQMFHCTSQYSSSRKQSCSHFPLIPATHLDGIWGNGPVKHWKSVFWGTDEGRISSYLRTWKAVHHHCLCPKEKDMYKMTKSSC